MIEDEPIARLSRYSVAKSCGPPLLGEVLDALTSLRPIEDRTSMRVRTCARNDGLRFAPRRVAAKCDLPSAQTNPRLVLRRRIVPNADFPIASSISEEVVARTAPVP